jgi:hypothetical protein
LQSFGSAKPGNQKKDAARHQISAGFEILKIPQKFVKL